MAQTHAAKILAHSISPNGDELITYEMICPRIVLSELNTHRELSRNSASSRAIPITKMMKMVQENPYVPSHWPRNKKGMQGGDELSPQDQVAARAEWDIAKENALTSAESLLHLRVHKGLTNRLLEPFMWHTIILTSTLPGLMNFFHLRDHPAAHPDIQAPAAIMHQLWKDSTPKLVRAGHWHLPLVWDQDWDAAWGLLDVSMPPPLTTPELGILMAKICSGRCARVSYLTHDGVRDINKDIELCNDLLGNGHMSPLEHPSRPMTLAELETYRMYHYTLEDGYTFDSRQLYMGVFGARKIINTRITHRCGNFDGWMQYRKTIPNEHDKMAHLEKAD